MPVMEASETPDLHHFHHPHHLHHPANCNPPTISIPFALGQPKHAAEGVMEVM
jgi:hypothetical protein